MRLPCFTLAFVCLAGCTGVLSATGGDSPGTDGGIVLVDGGRSSDMRGGGVDSSTVDTGRPDARTTMGPVCGNGIVEAGETCDGDCPTSCAPMACTSRMLVGSECDRRCQDAPITTCAPGDGCCASGCTESTDSDCTLDCHDLAGWPADWTAEEDAALVRMNAERAAGSSCPSGPKSAVGAFVMDPQLRIAARCHSMDMATNDFFSHTGSNGSRFSARIGEAGYTASPRAENIAAGNATGDRSVGQWMASSSGHCDAIMNGGYNEVGIGYVSESGTRWTHYWTANFGAR